MTLKDVVELATSPRFSEDSLAFFEMKISEHCHLFQRLFPSTRLQPKRHYLEHYLKLIQTFGPLVDVWTMRFEGKHKFFKNIVHFKNVCLTLAVRHQRMMGFHLASPSFFKPPVEIQKLKAVVVSSFPDNVQQGLFQKNGQQNTVLVASSVCVDGIKYAPDMIVSAGPCAGLPDFRQVIKGVVISTHVCLQTNDIMVQ